ncbi:hypothetical protein MANES_08G004902v8 [Manihot esculenta]|uniref:Uncharacterized protein n=1 Tax=Manihot esculenta TaxID=3983 RepID=A0ACB7H8F9_MANES|nr:hypothetical protein MANES_08G004902v8 [Manihot esculenta]
MHIEQPYANLNPLDSLHCNLSYMARHDLVCFVTLWSIFIVISHAESMPLDGVHFASQRNPAPMSNAFISSSHSAEVSYYQPDAAGPSHDPFLHSSTVGTFCAVPENLPSSCEGGSTSRFYGAGSSSDPSVPSELRLEKPNLDPQYMVWECITMTPGHRGNLSIGPESSIRNVRSRPALDIEINLSRTHLSNNSSHNSYHAVDFSSQSSSAMTHNWCHTRTSTASGRMLVSDANGYTHETNHFLVGSSIPNASADVRGYHHDFISSRNPVVPQSFHSASAHSARGIRSSYSQRPSPTFRASSSSLPLGHMAPSDDGMPLVAENFSSRQPRLLSTAAWRNSDRNGRSRNSYERYRSLPNEPSLHDRFSSEGFMVVDRSAFYGSRNLFDQHRDMRLDIDNMSYEELLALGERIGSVSTGFDEDLISKCLTETVYRSSGQSEDEGTCVICLEEYKDMDDVGSCIKKWLSMKNLCPICKASAVADNMKE